MLIGWPREGCFSTVITGYFDHVSWLRAGGRQVVTDAFTYTFEVGRKPLIVEAIARSSGTVRAACRAIDQLFDGIELSLHKSQI
ncbi:hypothetical protein O162_07885 [Pseudomonas putida SJ3]|nr:hypothetical protein O162_07885 [Pseudomonas putida SJ3]